MKNTVFATWKSVDDFIAGKPADFELSHEYVGEVAKLDRWGQSQAKNNENTATQTASQAGSNAASEESQLVPFASQEMNATHSLTPGQINEILTSAGAGAAGAAGAVEGEASRAAARTRNASGFAKDLDQAARDRMKTGAGIGEGVAAEDVMGAQKLRQEGAGLMGNLFQTDTNKQLQAMNIANEDVNTELKAGQTGWLQNTEGFINTLSGAGDAAAKLGVKV